MSERHHKARKLIITPGEPVDVPIVGEGDGYVTFAEALAFSYNGRKIAKKDWEDGHFVCLNPPMQIPGAEAAKEMKEFYGFDPGIRGVLVGGYFTEVFSAGLVLPGWLPATVDMIPSTKWRILE